MGWSVEDIWGGGNNSGDDSGSGSGSSTGQSSYTASSSGGGGSTTGSSGGEAYAAAGQAVLDSTVNEALAQEAAGDQHERNQDLMRESQRFNATQAGQNRLWQERMSNSAYQRQRWDLIKAGLNPSLAYGKGGGGASTPSGATASAGAPSAALGHRAALTSGSVVQLHQQALMNKSQLALNDASRVAMAADAMAKTQNAAKTAAETQAVKATLDALGAEGKNRAEKARYDNQFIQFDSVNQRAKELTGTINNALDIFNPLRYLPKLKGSKRENYGPGGEHTGTTYQTPYPLP